MEKIIIGLRQQILTIEGDQPTAALKDLGLDYQIIGQCCDGATFGDNCAAGCRHFGLGTCPAKLMTDNKGKLIHVRPIKDKI